MITEQLRMLRCTMHKAMKFQVSVDIVTLVLQKICLVSKTCTKDKFQQLLRKHQPNFEKLSMKNISVILKWLTMIYCKKNSYNSKQKDKPSW